MASARGGRKRKGEGERGGVRERNCNTVLFLTLSSVAVLDFVNSVTNYM